VSQFDSRPWYRPLGTIAALCHFGDMEIRAQRRTYSEAEWRRIVREGLSPPLVQGRTVDDEISVIIDIQEVVPGSAQEARHIAREVAREMGL